MADKIFRWKKRPNDEEWIGILDNCHVITLRQKSKMIEFELLNDENVDKSIDSTYIETRLRHYFRLDHDIDNLYSKWASQDDNFAKIAPKFKGIRLLRQDVLENIFSFICSSNNNISRISRMIESLCTKYGAKVFPPIDVLANVNVDSELSYRAKFINQSARHMMEASNGNGNQWIDQLTKMNYEDAKRELMSLPGIGAKVADCICLMSLNHTEAIPVDTHVLQITTKHYLPHMQKVKSLTTQREKFQDHAGWAQTVLFCSDLRQMKANK
ncbi:8-oxoguanine glycosylase ogg1 [Blomia tropicalis]|nr:8-oxoguanine glycosylase ogg1 [Blomia tropicalis]